jgi:hypothetical protein
VSQPQPTTSAGRETRLLIVTLAVSAVLLIVLSRFRFPATPQAPAERIVAPALERLAARATYDELAGIIAGVDRLITPSMLVLEVTSATRGSQVAGEVLPRPVPALRIRDNLAVVALQPGERVRSGRDGSEAEIVGRDDLRELAVVRVSPAAAHGLPIAPDPVPDAPPRYAALLEASRAGTSVRPVFLTRSDPIEDLRWAQPLVALEGVVAVQPGAFVFTLQGELLGTVTVANGSPALVPASLVLAVVSNLAQGRSRARGSLGILWQPLTPALARATGASAGVVVGGVAPGGPASAVLRPGDVVQSINGVSIRNVAQARSAEASVPPGETAHVTATRGDEPLTAAIVAHEAPADAAAPAGVSADLGIALRSGSGGLEVLRVDAGAAADVAGVLPGDVITHVDRSPVTRAAALQRAWEQAPATHTFLLTVTRNNTTLVLALPKS